MMMLISLPPLAFSLSTLKPDLDLLLGQRCQNIVFCPGNHQTTIPLPKKKEKNLQSNDDTTTLILERRGIVNWSQNHLSEMGKDLHRQLVCERPKHSWFVF